MITQVFNHPELGPIEFQDKKESVHSQPARSNDIVLLRALNNRQLTSAVKQDIVKDINNPEEKSENPLRFK
jgi:hypothetical protein